MDKDTSVIPYGCYCYTFKEKIKNYKGEHIGFDINLCPYWKVKKLENSEIEYYCCEYLNENDMGNPTDDRYEAILNYFCNNIKEMYKFFTLDLLWDEVKECNINESEEE